VRDLERALVHYAEVLGFASEYVGGQPPEFAIVSRDGLPIMLRLVPDGTELRPNESQGGTWDAFFWVEGLDALAAELSAAGAEVVYGPVVQAAYGMTELAIRDLDGYVLGFGEPLDPSRTD
jgi:predicted enzyme related to lactoylglutathione lyase